MTPSSTVDESSKEFGSESLANERMPMYILRLHILFPIQIAFFKCVGVYHVLHVFLFMRLNYSYFNPPRQFFFNESSKQIMLMLFESKFFLPILFLCEKKTFTNEHLLIRWWLQCNVRWSSEEIATLF